MQLRFVMGPSCLALAAALLAALSLAIASAGQEPGKTMPETPAPAPPPAHAAPSDYAAKNEHLLLTDFGDLARFHAANAALPPAAPGENRVVFMGDSITEGWKIEGPEGTFPGKPYINRGISGQTTPQMLVRFRQDVIDLKPKVVVILAGTNDIAENTGPMTLEETEENLASMADLGTSNHIRVVLCSITPAFDFPWRPGLDPAAKIVKVNAWIQAYATQKGYVYVDYYSALKDARGGLPPNLSHDGVHPNPAAYAIIAPLAEAGIAKALAQGAQ